MESLTKANLIKHTQKYSTFKWTDKNIHEWYKKIT